MKACRTIRVKKLMQYGPEALFCFFLSFSFLGNLRAEQEASVLQEKIEFEAKRAGTDGGFLVLDPKRASTFREYLQEDLYRLVNSGQFVLEIAASGSAWPKPSQDAAESAPGQLKAFSVRSPYVEQSYEMLLFEGEKLRFSAKTKRQRVKVPEGASGKGKPQLFREMFTFEQPRFLEAQRAISFRFQEAAEDLVWIRSALNGATREVGPFGRYEDVLGFPIALNDFDGFSSNIEAGEIFSERETIFLVPQLRGPKLNQNIEGDCVRLRWDHGQKVWNTQTNRYFEAKPWLPSVLVFVPRKVKIIEWRPEKLLYGRGVTQVVVDIESGLPVQSTIFSELAVPKRLMLNAYGFAAAKGETRAAALLSLSLDLSDQSAALLSSPEVLWCGEREAKNRMTSFDPFRKNEAAGKVQAQGGLAAKK